MTAAKVSRLLTIVTTRTISNYIIFHSTWTKVFDTCKAQIDTSIYPHVALSCLSPINTALVACEKATANISNL